uniref:Putative ovule protein n=1 Tax=Solanum chacoense TaxID=4108 RepID=A0A0V0H2S6_SOLCH
MQKFTIHKSGKAILFANHKQKPIPYIPSNTSKFKCSPKPQATNSHNHSILKEFHTNNGVGV